MDCPTIQGNAGQTPEKTGKYGRTADPGKEGNKVTNHTSTRGTANSSMLRNILSAVTVKKKKKERQLAEEQWGVRKNHPPHGETKKVFKSNPRGGNSSGTG